MGLSDMVYVSKTEKKEMSEARERVRVRGGEGSFFLKMNIRSRILLFIHIFLLIHP